MKIPEDGQITQREKEEVKGAEGLQDSRLGGTSTWLLKSWRRMKEKGQKGRQ